MSEPNMCTYSFSNLILYCSLLSLSFTGADNHPFSLHTLSISDFNVSCYFKGQLVLPLYSKPQLHRMEYTQLSVMFFSREGLVWKRTLQRVELLLNSILMLHEPQIFRIFAYTRLRGRSKQVTKINYRHKTSSKHETWNEKTKNI